MGLWRRLRRPSMAAYLAWHRKHRADTVTGLRAAAGWIETQPAIAPGIHTSITVELESDLAVHAFGQKQGLVVEETDDLAICTVHFGPVRVEVTGSAWDRGRRPPLTSEVAS